MDDTKQYRLDFSQCMTWGEIYALIKKELELPDWCGENINALWDALTGMMYVPAEITVSKAVGNPNLLPMVQQIISVMYQAQEEYHEISVIEEA